MNQKKKNSGPKKVVQRSTKPGSHLPVMLLEVMSVLQPQPGEVAVDCTLGGGGHALELLKAIGPQGRLIGNDLDGANFSQLEEKFKTTGISFSLHQGNFAGLLSILGGEGLEGVDVLVADLGMSSLQLDEQERGFSYARDGLLDMRMNRSRGRTASELLATIGQQELAEALAELGDEPEAEIIAEAIINARDQKPIARTGELVQIIMKTTGATHWSLHPRRDKWNIHPAARTFQALRILVNRELNNLDELLRVLPQALRSGGRAAIISFHSGEDRRVKSAFRAGLEAGVYKSISEDPLRPSFEERQTNPRSRSAKLRWARR